MITKEQNKKKYCCFYVSDFHLEMILLPYIKKNIDNSKIVIFTEENLLDTIKILLDRTNFDTEEKNKILDLHYWNNKKIESLSNNNEKHIFIINGSINYIEKINKKIEEFKFKKITIVDCYNVEKIDITEIKRVYDYKLNTIRI